MKRTEWYQSFIYNRRLAFIISNILVCLMMVCVAYGFVQLGQKIVPGWNGAYIIILSLIVSLESIYSFHAARERDGKELFYFRASEIITISILVKLTIYFVKGFSSLLSDLNEWQSNFLFAFFTPEYLFALFIILTTWIFCQTLANDIDEIHWRQEDATWDELGLVQNNLKAIRNRIVDQVYLLGGIVIFLAIVSRADVRNLLPLRFDTTIPIFNVIAFFIFGLLLLTQTQFALLQTRWVWEKLHVVPNLPIAWFKYSIVFFVIIGVIVFFLPTEYSVGLLDIIRFVIFLLWQVFTAIIFIGMLLFSYLMSLFAGSPEEIRPETSPIRPAMPPPVNPEDPIAWLEFLKSIAFWIILLAIFSFAIINYIRQNAALIEALRRIPLIRWLLKGLSSFMDWMVRINKKVVTIAVQSMNRIQARTKQTMQRIMNRVTAYWMLSPSEQIIYFFSNLIENASQKGFPRKNYETPFSYTHKLESDLLEVKDDLEILSNDFVESRYSNHEISIQQAKKAEKHWERIIVQLRRPPQKKS